MSTDRVNMPRLVKFASIVKVKSVGIFELFLSRLVWMRGF